MYLMAFCRPSFYFMNANGLISPDAMGIKHQPGLKVNFKCFNNSWAPFENFNGFSKLSFMKLTKGKRKEISINRKNYNSETHT